MMDIKCPHCKKINYGLFACGVLQCCYCELTFESPTEMKEATE